VRRGKGLQAGEWFDNNLVREVGDGGQNVVSDG